MFLIFYFLVYVSGAPFFFILRLTVLIAVDSVGTTSISCEPGRRLEAAGEQERDDGSDVLQYKPLTSLPSVLP